jgi:hypothetical protein
MFLPNTTGSLRRLTGTNRYGEPAFAAAETVECGIVRLVPKDEKTSVRSDSSATRGTAEELVVQAKVLFPVAVAPKRGDFFVYMGVSMRITAAQPRIAVNGRHDHWECDLEHWELPS